MAVEGWDTAEIERLARESGRPLEIQCASAFLKSKWCIRHSTYFSDVISGSARELDLTAEKWEPYEAEEGFLRSGIGVYVSCKGFRPDQSPMAYTVDNKKLPDVHRPQVMHSVKRMTYARSRRGPEALSFLFRELGLSEKRRISTLELVERKPAGKGGHLDYRRVPDKELFEGIDSSLKGAIYWSRVGLENYSPMALHVPVLILSKPWYEIPIDGGVVGKAKLRTLGYKTTYYPHRGANLAPQLIMSIILTVSEVGNLVNALDSLYGWYIDETKPEMRSLADGIDERAEETP